MIEIDLLGPVRIRASGQEIPLPEGKQRAVLAILAANVPPHRAMTQIIDGLWGEHPPASVRNAIQVYVTGLRKVLGPSGLEVRHVGDGYELRGADVSVDVIGFEAGVAEGRTALRLGDAERAAAVLHKAMCLWRGEPYAGMGDLPFVATARDTLRATRVGAAHDLAAALSRSGRPGDAIEVCRSVLVDDPYDEVAWGQLAHSQYWAGHQQDALQTCRRARLTLSQELGLDPLPGLSELEAQILRHQVPPPVEPEQPPEPSRDLPALPEVFVGRDAVIRDILDTIDSGARLVSVVGMGGIGKSAVAAAVAHAAQKDGRPVWFCSLEMETRAETARLKVRHASGLDPSALADESWSAAHGGLLVLDNVEQIQGIGQLVTDIVRQVTSPQVIVTSRTPLNVRSERLVVLPPLDCGAHGPAEDLFLSRADQQGRTLSASDRSKVPDLCEALGGIPLAVEFAAARIRVRSVGQLLEQLGQGTPHRDLGGFADLPPRQASLRRVLASSVELLTPASRTVLFAASVCEGWMTADLLERVVAGHLDTEFADALEELTTSGIGTLDADGRVRIPPPVRRYVHATQDRSALRASFIRATQELVAATAPVLLKTADKAGLQRLQQDDDALTTAMSAARADGNATLAAQVAIQLQPYWLMTGRFTQAQQLLTELADEGVPPDLRARLGILKGTFASYLTHPDAVPWLEAALAAATSMDLEPDRIIVNGWCSLAAMYVRVEDHVAAQEASDEARNLAERSADPSLLALTLDLEAFVAAYMHDYERALSATLSGILDSRRTGDAYRLAGLLTSAGDNLVQLGRYDEAGAVLDEAFEIAGAVEIGPMMSYTLVCRAQMLACAGRLAVAIPTLLEAIRTCLEAHPDPALLGDALFILAGCETLRDQSPLAARLYGASDAWYAEVGLRFQGRTAEAMIDLRAELLDRMGAQTFEVYRTLGAANPRGAVEAATTSGQHLSRAVQRPVDADLEHTHGGPGGA